MFKKLVAIFVLFASSVISLSVAYADGEHFNIDAQIKALELKETPKNVVSLCASGTETLSVLGMKPTGYAVLGSGTLPSYLKSNIKKSTNVGSVATPSLERIKVLHPDLILIDRVYENQSDYIDNLKKIAPVLDVRAENYQEMLKNVSALGSLFKKEKEAKIYTEKFSNRLNTAKTQIHQKQNVLGIFISSRIIWAWTDKSFFVSLLKDVGIPYAYEGSGSKYYSDILQASVEKILKIDPDYLFVFDEPSKNSVQFLKQSPAWKHLKAVKNNHILKLDRDTWSRSKGPMAALIIMDDLNTMLKP